MELIPRRRLTGAALAAALFWVGGTARAAGTQAGAAVVFPGTTTALRDGDIVLNDALGVANVFNREFGFPHGPYTHASVFVETPEGGQVVGFSDSGIVLTPPATMLRRNFRLALVRPLTSPPPGALRGALTRLQERGLVFDYDMRWPAADSRETYCAGFVSQLFRLAGLSDPFPRPLARDGDFWVHWARRELDLDLTGIVSPNAVLAQPDFRLLAQYQSPSRSLEQRMLIGQVTMQRVKAYLADEGLVFRPPKPGARLVLGLLQMGVVDGVTLARLPPSRQGHFFAVHELLVRVEQRVARSMRLSDQVAWSDAELQALTESIADGYRDDFFMRPAAAS